MLDDYLSVKTVLVGLLIYLCVYYLVKYLQFRVKYRLPPGPLALPLAGNLIGFLFEDAMKVFHDLQKRYGKVFSLWIGPYHSISLNTLEVVDEALVKHGTDFAGRPSLPSLERLTKGGKDILMADYGPVWKVQRKIAHTALRSFTEGDKITHHLLNNFKDMAKDWTSRTEAFDPRETISLFTYNILMSMTFNEKFEKDDPEFRRLLDYVIEAPTVLGNGFVTDVLPSCFEFLERKKLKYLEDLTKLFDDMTIPRIKKHKEQFDPDNLHDLVDHMISVEEKAKTEEESSVMSQLTDDHFVYIIFDLFGAGTDTTRESLLCLLLYVGAHPEVQEKLIGEIDRVVGRNRLPEAQDVPSLRYTEAVVFETLRISSILPLSFPHKVMCDTKVGGYDIPKDTMVFVNLLALHFDPEHWDRPDKFNPDRFIDKDGSITKPRAWMPFSGGRRVCPGEALAKRELTYITALIYHQLDVSVEELPKNPLEPEINSIILRSPKNYKIKVSARK